VDGLVEHRHPSLDQDAGGVPLFADGRLVGAVGASGGTAGQDEECVSAAAHALGFATD
jgi:uncharacterized protein GlcG (DUF336 family)